MRRIISTKRGLRERKLGRSEVETVAIVEDKEKSEIYVKHLPSNKTFYVGSMEEANILFDSIFGKFFLDYQKDTYKENRSVYNVQENAIGRLQGN